MKARDLGNLNLPVSYDDFIWPIPEDLRKRVISRLADIIDDPESSNFDVFQACKALVAFSALSARVQNYAENKAIAQIVIRLETKLHDLEQYYVTRDRALLESVETNRPDGTPSTETAALPVAQPNPDTETKGVSGSTGA